MPATNPVPGAAARGAGAQERHRAARAAGRPSGHEVVRRIALTHPRNGEWERTWVPLQKQAKRVLEGEANKPGS